MVGGPGDVEVGLADRISRLMLSSLEILISAGYGERGYSQEMHFRVSLFVRVEDEQGSAVSGHVARGARGACRCDPRLQASPIEWLIPRELQAI